MPTPVRETPFDPVLWEPEEPFYGEKVMQSVVILYESGAVKRYHAKRTHVFQTVADHAWGVALLITRLHPNPRADLLKAAILHDAHEVITGDVPYTVKAANPELKKLLTRLEVYAEETIGLGRSLHDLPPEDFFWLKAADMMELVLYCRSEMMLGNKHIEPIWDRGREVLRSNIHTPEPILNLLTYVEKNRETCTNLY